MISLTKLSRNTRPFTKKATTTTSAVLKTVAGSQMGPPMSSQPASAGSNDVASSAREALDGMSMGSK